MIKKKAEELVAKSNFCIRKDVLGLLKKACRLEKDKKSKRALEWILENSRIAESKKIALCQDTGLPVLFVQFGKGVSISSLLIKSIEEGIEQGYKKNYLRASLVDPLERNKGSYKGVITHIKYNSRIKGVKVTLFPKGFGSENKSRLKMFNPTVLVEEIEDFVVESVKQAGAQSCPPFVVGIGIGGTSDYALCLAKEALIERIDKSNSKNIIKRMEQNINKKINDLNIGPMGLGGSTTALAVKIKKTKTHIAGLPVGLNISCWALRSASFNIK